ncbi:MAG: HAD family hydrolase [Chloroflexi bacterium]|nr:HAD family hydrolase [Chloroflexota bacterium]
MQMNGMLIARLRQKPAPEPAPAVFLDRDGIINALVPKDGEGFLDSPYSLEEFRLLPQAAAAVRALNQKGLLTIVVSNQPGVAKGKCTLAFLEALNARMVRCLEVEGASLDGIYYCLHHPQAVVQELRMACGCRKPRPGLLLKAAEDFSIDLARSYAIGDNWTDCQAGLAAGCSTILIHGPGTRPAQAAQGTSPHREAKSLAHAILSLAQERG